MKFSEIKVGQVFHVVDENSTGKVVEVEVITSRLSGNKIVTVQLDDALGTYFWGNPDETVGANFVKVGE